MPVPYTSLICVTNRPVHRSSVMKQFSSQIVPRKELIIVDNSEVSWCSDFVDSFLQYRHVEGKRMVGELRNIGMSMARGDVLAWLDDDDWRHPDSIRILWDEMKRRNLDIVGPRKLWFVDEAGNTRFHKCESLPIFGATLLRRKVCEVKFNEQAIRASDNPWLKAIRRREDLKMGLTEHEFLLVAVSHGKNISNPVIKESMGLTVDDLDERIGPEFGLKAHVDRLFASIREGERDVDF